MNNLNPVEKLARSVKVPNKLWKLDLKWKEKYVLAILHGVVQTNNNNISLDELSQITDLSKKSISRSLKNLEKFNIINVEKRKFQNNYYTINKYY